MALFVAILLINLGEQLWSEFLPTYFVSLGGSIIALGIFKSMADLLETISQYPGGILSDRIGRINAALIFLVMGTLGYMVYLLSPTWQFLFLGLVLLQGTSGLLQPTLFSIIGDYIPKEKRTNAFSLQSILKRLPIVIAPAIGGFLIASMGIIPGVRLGLEISIILGISSILLVSKSKKISTENSTPENTTEDKKSSTGERTFPKNLKILLIADSLARFGQAMVKVLIVLYVVGFVGSQTFGLLVSFQMAVAILSYLPAAALAERVGNKPVIFVGFLCFALYPSAIVLANSLPMIAIGFFLAGFREFGEPARKALIVNLSNSDKRGRAVGIYYTIRSFSIIPAGIIGSVLWQQSPALAAITASSIAGIGLIVFAVLVKPE